MLELIPYPGGGPPKCLFFAGCLNILLICFNAWICLVLVDVLYLLFLSAVHAMGSVPSLLIIQKAPSSSHRPVDFRPSQHRLNSASQLMKGSKTIIIVQDLKL